MIDLSKRSNLPEKMDDLNAPEKELRQNLRELEVINNLLGGYSVVLGALNSLNLQGKKLSVMDLGCGGGDMLRAVANWAKKKNKDVKLLGIDLNPVMISYAKAASSQLPDIEFRLANVFDDKLLNEKPDIVICSLFCHHFEDEQLVALLKRMTQLADKAVIVNDLHRDSIAYYAISILTSIFSKTYMVRYDAKLSVARAFKRSEWRAILAKAGVTNYTLKWRWAWRWELIIKHI